MQKYSTIKYCSLVFCILLVFSEMTSSVPFYSDDENDLAGSNRDKDFQIRNRSIVLNNELRMKSETAVNVSRNLQVNSYFLCPDRTTWEKKVDKSCSLCKRDNQPKLMNIRDLYELLLKKKALDDQLALSHQISRKSNRSPSLRLRFGKKRDPYFGNPPLMGHPFHVLEDVDNL